jgi:hypothetical protein
MQQWIMINTNVGAYATIFYANNNNNIELSLYQTLHCPKENCYSYKFDW